VRAAETPEAAAARDRVDAVLDRLRRTTVDVVVVSLPPADVDAARERAWAAARDAGRTDLMTEATSTARELGMRAFAGAGFTGTWAASEMAVSVASAKDRVAAATAFEDAASAAVVEDLVDADTVGHLRATFDEIDRLRELPPPGTLSELTSSIGARTRGPGGILAISALVIVGIVGVGVGWALGIGLLGVAIVLAAGLFRQR
jgi:hypothetical protein